MVMYTYTSASWQQYFTTLAAVFYYAGEISYENESLFKLLAFIYLIFTTQMAYVGILSIIFAVCLVY